MSDAATARVQLIDVPGESRTTATLLSSLAARLTALSFISGSTAAASVVSGMAVLGQRVSRTAEGMRLRSALEAGRLSTNGERIWSVLHLDEWAANAPPANVVDQLRNDIALLLADDLDALELVSLFPALPAPPARELPEKCEILDYIIGLWALSKEFVQVIESISATTARHAEVTVSAAEEITNGGPWLR